MLGVVVLYRVGDKVRVQTGSYWWKATIIGFANGLAEVESEGKYRFVYVSEHEALQHNDLDRGYIRGFLSAYERYKRQKH